MQPQDTPPESPRAIRDVHFQDPRPPQAIQWRLERDLMQLMVPLTGEEKYTLHCVTRRGNHRFGVWLVFEAATAELNRYTLRVELWDAGSPSDALENLEKTLGSWMGFWARDFAPVSGEVAPGLADRYAQLVDQAQRAESHLRDVPSLQQEILRRMREGALFRTAHKEGGTTIVYRSERWSREDYGESTSTEHFHSESEFLAFLRRFFEWTVSRNVAPDQLPEEQVWRLILRLLLDSDMRDPPPVRKSSTGVLVWAMVVATSSVLAMAKIRIDLRGRTPVPSIDALFYPSLGVLALCIIVAAVWLRRNWSPSPALRS